MQTIAKQALMIGLVMMATNAIAANLRDSVPPPSRSADEGSDGQAQEGRAPDFGPSSFFYSAIDGFGFQPGSSNTTYDRGFSSGAFYCRTGTPDNRAIGQFVTPHGVVMNTFRAWIYDDQATSGVSVDLQRSCLPDFGAGFPDTDTLSTVSSTNAFAGGDFSDFGSIAGTTLIDNQSCTYRILATPGTNACPGSFSLGVYKVRLQWSRFIPVAPAVATFTDVPVGSQFFREVEALVDSGVTAGCTATEFCPGNPVTRLQMAAFLARALGLPLEVIADPANP